MLGTPRMAMLRRKESYARQLKERRLEESLRFQPAY
jgi:hypothetical protein